MGRNLSTLFISQSYQFLTQISGSELQDGLGNKITGSLAITSSQAISSSFAITASFALNGGGGTVSTASLLTTASAANNVITFTKGDSSQFTVTVATGSAATVNTGSLLVTASISNATTTFTKGDGSTFSITANNVVNANTASYVLNAVSASFATSAATATSASFASFAVSSSNSATSISSSYSLISTSSSFATSAQTATSASFATSAASATSASFATNAATATSSSFATNANTATSASFATNATSAATASFLPSTTNLNITSISASTAVFQSASIGYLQTITGSILNIGESFIVLNTSDATRYAGIKVEDSGSSTPQNYTASFQFDSQTNDWFYEYSGSDPTNFGVAMFGPEYATIGSPTYLTNNRLSKGNGGHHLNDSTITDNGTNVTFTTPIAGTAISASTGFNGNLTGTASFATSASFATNALSSSYAVSASQAQNAVSASYAPSLSAPAGLVSGSSPNSMKSAAFLTAISASASGTSSIVLGNNAIGYADYSIIIGDGAHNYDDSRSNVVFIGRNAKGAQNAIGIGWGAEMLGDSGLAIGRDAKSNANESVTIGYNADTRNFSGAKGAIAIGRNTIANQEDEINIGNIIRYNSGSLGLIQLSGSTIITGSLSTSNTASIGLVRISSHIGNSQAFIAATSNDLNIGNASYSQAMRLVGSEIIFSNVRTSFPAGNDLKFLGGFQSTGSASITGSLNVNGSVTGNVLGNNTDTYTSSAAVQQVITLTQAEYNAISGSANANTLYVISDSIGFSPATFATTGSNTFNGNQIISGSLSVTGGITGSMLGTASFAVFATGAGGANSATSASYALSASFATSATNANTATSASFATSAATANTASFFSLASVTQNAVFSGSVRGEVKALSIASNTASLDCSTENFFTLTLVSGSNTFINPSNIAAGQTINLRVTQPNPGNGTVSFPTSVKQVSGSSYVPSVGAGPQDIVTFISFDASSLYLSNVKNLV